MNRTNASTLHRFYFQAIVQQMLESCSLEVCEELEVPGGYNQLVLLGKANALKMLCEHQSEVALQGFVWQV